MNKVEYAVYQGDELLALGTADECAKLLNISPDSVRFMSYKSHRQRVENSKHPEQARIAIRVEDEG